MLELFMSLFAVSIIKVRDTDCQTVRQSGSQIVRLSDCQTVRLSDCQTARLSEIIFLTDSFPQTPRQTPTDSERNRQTLPEVTDSRRCRFIFCLTFHHNCL
ncbi:YALI0A06952p [Yarrowia lipolytica CLIB122]|uniref:YALI0A06952p n=2 Tax=Yarrowia lipolytica TaxID=4952 RepID=Q6CHN3_YARLI|nr:YALI0A06952p [Yarrowia lipolytica CLIB122]AOW00338.1 hypothetical protein YALI1_A06625g [Yarrowia lipolytica]KAB8281792.1 hypothetical protein BKA91DRAFT_29028 [Yarrowia lipolytica]KAE8170429.1 hypothetical protein BKA90DRAFT_36890 [Yarrowia lipolytica]CAG83754.2 YALI0A06952p [Yarrowia lipolytica CLIB122]|eukprot:XP_499828.2 YALI0A06952p [Yarrowia lipolytica CLIB122]